MLKFNIGNYILGKEFYKLIFVWCNYQNYRIYDNMTQWKEISESNQENWFFILYSRISSADIQLSLSKIVKCFLPEFLHLLNADFFNRVLNSKEILFLLLWQIWIYPIKLVEIFKCVLTFWQIFIKYILTFNILSGYLMISNRKTQIK